MRLDLKTLEEVKFMFELHSDHSSNCNGYRQLLKLIEQEKAFDVKPSCEKLKNKGEHLCSCQTIDQSSNAYCITCGGKKGNWF